jgi:hypothetical protein
MTENTNKKLSKRDFLKIVGGLFAFASLGGVTALFKNFGSLGKNNNKKIASGFGSGGYGV